MGACFGAFCSPRGATHYYLTFEHGRREDPETHRAHCHESPTATPTNVTSEPPTTSSNRLRDAFSKVNFVSSKRLDGNDIKKDLSSSGFSTRDRVNNILSAWECRGASRPITDFYEEISTLGSGAYGVVQKWRCKGEGTAHVNVAVKRIDWRSVWGGIWRNASKEDEIRNELKLLLVIDHPFIVKFREWFEHPCKGIYFVMELCEGTSLQNVLDDVCAMASLEERRSQLSLIRRYFREITYAVSYIHGLEPPIVHRDLKPDNILISSKEEWAPVKLIDFGLAALKEGTCENQEVGTMIFMAPEIFMKRQEAMTEEVDLWALGVIFTWMITAIERASLQHPMCDIDEGVAFDVDFIVLHDAYRDEAPLNESLFESDLGALEVAKSFLRHYPSQRKRAAEILQLPWLKTDDPAASASVQLMRNKALKQNLASYRKLDKFDQLILSLVADNATDMEVLQFRRTFRALDTDRDGRLSKQEVIDGFKRSQVKLPEETVQELFEYIDRDGGDRINYNEWLAATIGQGPLRSEAGIRNAFRCLDTAGVGRISHAALVVAVGQEDADRLVGPGNFMTFEEFSEAVHHIATKRDSYRMGRQATRLLIEEDEYL